MSSPQQHRLIRGHMFSSFKADYFFYTFLQMKWQEGTLEVELIWEDFMNMLPSNVCDNVIN